MDNIKKANPGSRLGGKNGSDHEKTSAKLNPTGQLHFDGEIDSGGTTGLSVTGRTGIYARVSSSLQEKDETVKSQLAAVFEYAKEHDIEVAQEDVFTDEGYSGSTLMRPALDAFRDRVSEGMINRVLIYDPDRLARSYVHQALLIEELQERDCVVDFVRCKIGQSPDEQLLLQMQGVIAEYERAKIQERTRRGRMHRMRQGEIITGRRTFGYDYIRRTTETPAHYVRIDSEASTASSMFDWYAHEGLALRAIAERLNDAGILTVRGNLWHKTSVRNILRNPIYTGTGYANRTESILPKNDKPLTPVYRKNPKSGKRPRDRDEWFPFNCPAIITQETFDIAGERLEANKAKAKRNTRHDYLLRGLILCGKCHKHMQIDTRRQVYYCPYTREIAARDSGVAHCQSEGRFPIQDMDNLIWKEVVQLLSKPSLLKEQHRSLKGKIVPKVTGGYDALRQKEGKLNEQLKRLNSLFIKGMIDENEHGERFRKLNEQLQQTAKQLKADEQENQTDEEMAQLLETFAKFSRTIKSELNEADFSTRREIAEQIVKCVILKKNDVTIEFAAPLKKCNLRTPNGR